MDDKWTPDESNPLHEPDGFGGDNSILKIGSVANKDRLSIYADELTRDTLVIRAAGGAGIRSIRPWLSCRMVQVGCCKPRPSHWKAHTRDGSACGSWIRVIAVDAGLRASNVIRCSLGDPTPFRWQDAIMYYALTDRFRNGDKSNDHPVENPKVKSPANYHGGDWRGIEEKIKDGVFQETGYQHNLDRAVE